MEENRGSNRPERVVRWRGNCGPTRDEDMANGPLTGVIRTLRRATLLPDEARMTDGQLLRDYLRRRDEAALATLVERHAPMVWGVCCRVLADYHDAEDAFQATFLVLVRRAASIASPDALANWLYGVAHQTATKARAMAARRRTRERQVTDVPEPAAAEQGLWNDLRPVLDEELSRLPEAHRTVLVLCDLEGKTRAEAARSLCLPEGTVGSRLARARAMLAKRLGRRGVVLSGGALAAVLAQNVASAGAPGAPVAVVSNTIRAASVFAAGQAAAGPVSVGAAALADGVLKAMMLTKLKAVVAVALVLGLLAAGATAFSSGSASARGNQPPAAEAPVPAPQKPDPEKEAFTAWGKEINGLQAGLGFKPGQKRSYSLGETVTLVVRVRNVGKEEVKFQYLRQFFIETPPTVTNGAGKPVRLASVTAFGFHVPVDVTLAPGKEIELYEWKRELRPAKWIGNDGVPSLYGTGTFSVQYERVFGNSSSGSLKIDPELSKLATGKLELEVKEPEKKPDPEKEAFTAWGKEINGLQAGVGFPAGQKRAYSHGETVTLVVRVRNVGKEEVKFQYVPQFFKETPPTVTDSAGKAVPLRGADALSGGRMHSSADVTLAPGKEVELYEWNVALRPASDPGRKNPNIEIMYGTGKFSIQYERVLANSSASMIKIDSALSKLATGRLELEVKEPEKQPQKKEEKESFTAWGKEIKGLQAGLGFRAGEKRAYHFGEKVVVVARIRNLTKEVIEFEHIWAFFVENAPKILDPSGKVVQLPRYAAEGRQMPRITKVPAGGEVALYEWEFDLDAGWKANHGAGTFTLQYERVVGPTLGNPVHPNPALDKLATGKLELEITSEPPANRDAKPDAPRELTVGGTVVDEDGKPVDGAVVTIQRNTYAEGAGKPRVAEYGKTKTDARGRFEIKSLTAVWETEPGSGFDLTFSAQGMAPVALAVGKGFDPKKEITIVLKREKEKEELTAWGMELNGLQAGLGFRAGEKRAYRHGETVTLVVRVRNVGKEDVKIQYTREFFGLMPPEVTDGAGKSVPQPGPEASPVPRVPAEATLAPGKELELTAVKLELSPASASGNDITVTTLFGTGKLGVRYKQVDGLSPTPDPILGKLATGKLELEINPNKE
jgi:RNA polymerase sigma factor (sigma-70 family)